MLIWNSRIFELIERSKLLTTICVKFELLRSTKMLINWLLTLLPVFLKVSTLDILACIQSVHVNILTLQQPFAFGIPLKNVHSGQKKLHFQFNTMKFQFKFYNFCNGNPITSRLDSTLQKHF